MKNRLSAMAGVVLCISFAFGLSPTAQAQVPDTGKKEALVTKKACGTFEVKLTRQPTADSAGQTKISRMAFDKKFSGDLQATSKGEMLAAGTGAPGSSGGYVAIKQVSGSLNGKKGSFILQHSGTMRRGAPELVITVVPDSGADELKGLAGKMEIKIEEGKHSYVFEYTLPE